MTTEPWYEEVLAEASLGGRKIALAATRANVDPEAKLYAINLLDLERPWAYKLYGMLAYPLLRRAGGLLLWRGRLAGSGDEELRQTVLIVRYPRADVFLELATRPVFAAISLLRSLGVARFQFGLTERLDEDGPEPADPPKPYRGSSRYLLALARGVPSGSVSGHLAGMRSAAKRNDARLVFAGRRAAVLGTRLPDEETLHRSRLAPPLPWETVLLFEADTEEALERSRQSAEAVSWRQQASGHAAGIYRRQL